MGLFYWGQSVDFYEMVPKGFTENVRFRVNLRKACQTDAGLRKAMMDRCREDVLFFFSAFAWLHEPRPMKDDQGRELPEIIPFIPWLHQEPVIRTCRQYLGYEDIGVEKSRGEGMTWIALLLALHDWIFALPGSRMVKINVVSRNLEKADTAGDMDSLLEKVVWELDQLPTWMAGVKGTDWQRNISNHTVLNYRNKCVIAAYPATGEVGSGGRATYWIVDELSKFRPGEDEDALTSTQATSHSRLFIGTPYGSEGAYHRIMHEPSAMKKLVLKWQDNPTRNRGLYQMVRNVPVAIDPASNPLPPHYNPPNQEVTELFARLRKKGFRLERGLRSPWYDHECDRANADPFKIAQELDRDYGGSLYKIFTDDFFTAARKAVRPPFCKVNVVYDDQLQPTVNRASDGELLLWMTLDTHGRPPSHSYIVAADVSTGLGGTYTSNSVLEIIDALTMEQVGEFVSNTIPPDEFADLSVAICKWLGNAYLAWERNGPGNAYTLRVKEIGYQNVYLRTKLFDKRRRKKVREPGWWTDNKSKEVLFSELRRIVVTEELKLHSDALVQECQQYIRVGRAIQHVANARAGADSPDTGENHGDRVIALGIGVQALRDRPVAGSRDGPAIIQPGSIEERDREWAERAAALKGDDWDGRSNWDMMMGYSVGTEEL